MFKGAVRGDVLCKNMKFHNHAFAIHVQISSFNQLYGHILKIVENDVG